MLIGIIGVILFIGLALAGGLILGSDFTTATSSSQAAAVMSQLKQASDALSMYKLKTGNSSTTSQNTAFLIPRFLKSQAQNPSKLGTANAGQYLYSVHFDNDTCADTTPENIDPIVAIAPVDQDVCQAISDTYTNGTIPTDMTNPTIQAGCTKVTAATCGTNGGIYMAFYHL